MLKRFRKGLEEYFFASETNRILKNELGNLDEFYLYPAWDTRNEYKKDYRLKVEKEIKRHSIMRNLSNVVSGLSIVYSIITKDYAGAIPILAISEVIRFADISGAKTRKTMILELNKKREHILMEEQRGDELNSIINKN